MERHRSERSRTRKSNKPFHEMTMDELYEECESEEKDEEDQV